MGINFKRIGTGIATGGLSEVYRGIGGKEALFGKGPEEVTPEAIKADQEKARNIRSGALDELVSSGNVSERSLRPQVEREKEAIRTGTQDTLRKLRELRTARGQVGTSLGLGQEKSLIERGAKGQLQLEADLPERLRKLKEQIALTKINATGNVLGTPGTILMNQGTSGAAPVLGTLAGTGLGAAYGGPSGAFLGSQAGGGLGTTLSGLFGGR